METEVVTPTDLFFPPRQLEAPLFQRGYVWKKERQWEPLWKDISRVAENLLLGNELEPHFFGAIVVQEQSSDLSDLSYFTVIDGQQRLMSIQILLRAFYLEASELGDASLLDQASDLLKNEPQYVASPHQRFKMWPTERDQADFADVLTRDVGTEDEGAKAGPFTQAVFFFRDKIRKWLRESPDEPEERAEVLLVALTGGLEIATITLGPEEDGQAIFETLNARGTPLSAMDLVKNFLFQDLDAHGPKAEALYRKYWEPFETSFWEKGHRLGAVTASLSTAFLSHWIAARTQKPANFLDAYSDFKLYVRERSYSSEEALKTIHEAAMRYERLLKRASNPTRDLSQLEMFAHRMDALNLHVTRPLLVWLSEPDREPVPQDQYAKLISVAESWLVRRNLAGVSVGGLNMRIPDLLAFLTKSDPLTVGDAAEEYLAKRVGTTALWPDDEMVFEHLLTESFYGARSQRSARMVLEAIEDRLRGFQGGRRFSESPISRGTATIEHIMPQKWRRFWNDIGDDERAIEKRDTLINTIGNLTLVSSPLNSRLSNDPWVSNETGRGKRDALKKSSTLLITREICAEHPREWTDSDIQKRSRELAKRVVEIWPAPAGHSLSHSVHDMKKTRRISMWDLMTAGMIEQGTILHHTFKVERGNGIAVVSSDGRIQYDGELFETPSAAGQRATGWKSAQGWNHWRVGSPNGPLLAELRAQLVSGM